MKIIAIYLYVTLTLYFVVCHGLTEEDEMKRRASSASSGSLKQTLKIKSKKQLNHAMSVKKGYMHQNTGLKYQESNVNEEDAVDDEENAESPRDSKVVDDVVEEKEKVAAIAAPQLT